MQNNDKRKGTTTIPNSEMYLCWHCTSHRVGESRHWFHRHELKNCNPHNDHQDLLCPVCQNVVICDTKKVTKGGD